MTKVIDCSMGEGGGSIVRISVALAALTNNSLKLINIRAKRSNPGLRAQHLEAINALQQLSGMSVEGAKIGSQTVNIEEGYKPKDEALVNIRTAGSISLVSQAVSYYSFIQKRNIKLKIKGGATHGKWAPSLEYLTNVTHVLLKLMNKQIYTEHRKFGFFPKGGADIIVKYNKNENPLPLILAERGELEGINAYSTASMSLKSRKVAERQLNSFIKNTNPRVEVTPIIKYVDSISPGSGLTIVNQYSNGSRKGNFVPGEKHLSAERVGEICSSKWKKMEKNTGAIDIHATDQLIVPMALVDDNSEITADEISNHTKTNIELIKKFFKKSITIKKEVNHYSLTIKSL
ncbi:MAG: RNA 3'-phosphate cyclase [Candidatus Heimdallarchaeota archaeon]|nr:RNA 3'-phosphate cyclase [Candidatus Heimdallarchaeota archaeon]MCK4877370.1 RNA 3'-phosphate cyclase [Candidatus Heimdallarchaeota archaeon]